MASIYLRPTSDNYVTHTLNPSDSPNAYSLINEVTSDGNSTYIGVTCSTADETVTGASSFTFAGIDIPLGEYRFTGISVEAKCNTTSSSGSHNVINVITVSSNGITGISDMKRKSSSDILTYNYNITDSSFDRNGYFLQMVNNYVAEYNKLPDFNVTVTTHYTSSKNSQTFYISQLYIKLNYDVFVQHKNANFWSPVGRVYRKINGTWVQVSDGRAQITSQLNKKGGHRLVPMASKAATCTATGLTQGCKCSVCEEVFVPQEVTPMISHTPVTVEASEATCVKDGYSGGERCSVCSTVISGSIIPATGNHTYTTASAVEPTCNVAGKTEGQKCSVCGKVLSGCETIPATGNHTPVDAEEVAATCGLGGIASGTKCSVCGKVLSGCETIPATGNHTYVVNDDGIAATDMATGLTATTSCSVCGDVLVDHTVIPMTGTHTHAPVTVSGYAATCINTGLTDGQKCSGCGAIITAQQTIPATGVHNFTTHGSYSICSMCSLVNGLGYPNLSYQGTATGLSVARERLAATTVGNYALFGGGMKGAVNNGYDTVDAYNSSLTRSTATGLSASRYNFAATTVGNYALFGGGERSGSEVSTVDAYNSSLTRSTATGLTSAKNRVAATTVGNYALFGGGYDGSNYLSTVDAYNSSLTRSTATGLSSERRDSAATTVGNYALFGGGMSSSSTHHSTVDAYNSSLTRSTATGLSASRKFIAATTVGNYALFGGGNGSGTTDFYVNVDSYSTSLTYSRISGLEKGKGSLAATTVGNYALFGGGYRKTSIISSTSYESDVDVFDHNLTKTTTNSLSSGRSDLAATTVGNYALFGGGCVSTDSDGATSNVDVYKISYS